MPQPPREEPPSAVFGGRQNRTVRKKLHLSASAVPNSTGVRNSLEKSALQRIFHAALSEFYPAK